MPFAASLNLVRLASVRRETRGRRSAIRFGRDLVRCAAVLLFIWPVAAEAHRSSTGGPTSGLSIPGLTHGQMAVIADYRAAILALAAREPRPDATFQRLLNFGEIQRMTCLWGLVPGSVTDESSPFNECSHAYLAATKALLEHMRTMPDQREAVAALVSSIDMDMVRNGASFVLCAYSDEPFNTAGVIQPRWAQIPFEPKSLSTFTLATLAVGAGVLAIGRRTKAAPV